MSKSLKYLISVVGGIVLLLIAIPYFVPLEKYKGLIAQEVKKVTGRELTIAGDIKLSLLPRPTIKTSDINLASIANSHTPSLAIVKEAKAALELLPLLQGKIVIAYIRLESPEINLERLANGQANWEFGELNVPTNIQHAPPTSSKAVAKQELPVEIKQIIINNGIINYTVPDNKRTVENINLTLNVESRKGPIYFSLNFNSLLQDFNIDGKIAEIADIIPITATIKLPANIVHIQGNLNSNESSFNGDIQANGNLKHIPIVPNWLQNEYQITANFAANKEQITLNSLNFAMEPITANANGHYLINETTGTLQVKLEPGKIDLAINPEKVAEQHVGVKIELKASSLKSFLQAAKIELDKIPSALQQPLSFKAALYYRDKEIECKNINFSLGDISLAGNLSMTKTHSGSLSFSHNLHTNNGSSLFSLIESSSPINLTDLTIKGTTTKHNNIFTTNTNITTAKITTTIAGEVKLAEGVSPDISVHIFGDNLNYSLQQLLKAKSNPKLKAFNINSTIEGNTSKQINIKLNKSTINIGEQVTSIEGSSKIELRKAKPNISTELQVSGVNLDDLIVPSSPQALNPSSSPQSRSSGTVARSARWSKDKIDLAFLNRLDGELSFTCQKITKGALVFNNIKTNARLQNGLLDVNSLTDNFFGGSFNGSSQISSQNSQPITLNAAIKGADLKNISPEGQKIKITHGKLNLSANLKSELQSIYQLVNNLNGKVNFDSTEGKLSGINLQKVMQALTNIKNIEGVKKLLNSSFEGGETVFKNLVGELAITQGKANITKFNLESAGIQANAKGHVNLPLYEMDVLATINTNIHNMPPFGARLYGPLDDPSHQLDIKNLQQYLLQNVLPSLIEDIKKGKTRPQDLIKDIIGGGGKQKNASDNQSNDNSTNQDANNNSESKEQKSNPAEKLLKKGMKQLFNK